MIEQSVQRTISRQTQQGFSLTEILLSVAIVATVLLSLLGILPNGLNTSRQAVNHTLIAALLEDISQRLQGKNLEPGPVPGSPMWFDDRGVFLPSESAPETLAAKRSFRADVEIKDFAVQPEGTSGLKAAVIKLSWSLDPQGEPTGKKNVDEARMIVTVPVTTLSGPDWEAIDPEYHPKIEF